MITVLLALAGLAGGATIAAVVELRRRRNERVLQERITRIQAELDGARRRTSRIEDDTTRIVAAIRSSSTRLENASRGADLAFNEAREAMRSLDRGARAIAAGTTDVSALIVDTSRLNERAASIQERGSEAASRAVAGSREVSRGLHRLDDLSARLSESAASSWDAIDKARQASGRAVDRIREINRRGRELPLVAQRLSANGQEVRFAVADFDKETAAVLGVVLQAGHEIDELGRRADEIASIIEFLSSVAEETNLLALNAAIIAAEAGAEGRGFAVVAEEIRELSERMASSTREISTLVEAVRGGVRESGAAVRRGGERSAAARKLAERAAGALDGFLKEADNAARLARDVPASSVDRDEIGDDPSIHFTRAVAALGEAANVRDQVASEANRLVPAVEAIQVAAEAMGDAVADTARAHAEVASRLTRMQDLTLPLHRAGEEHVATEASRHESAARLERTLAELRERVNDIDRLLSPAERRSTEPVQAPTNVVTSAAPMSPAEGDEAPASLVSISSTRD